MYFGRKCVRAELFEKRGKLWILIYCDIITFKHGVKSYRAHDFGENITLCCSILYYTYILMIRPNQFTSMISIPRW